MLAINEIHEVIEPALYLMLSGLPDTNDTLVITDEHVNIINQALMAYRRLTSAEVRDGEREAVQSLVEDRISTMQTSRTVGLSRIINSFYFHSACHPEIAVNVLKEYVVEDTYVSASDAAIKLVLQTLTRAA